MEKGDRDVGWTEWEENGRGGRGHGRPDLEEL